MNNEFKNLDTKAQLKELRKIADTALKRFFEKPVEVNFINHGENTTYKITSAKGKFLLRLHRTDYHTKEAIEEELSWLGTIDEGGRVEVPAPKTSLKGEFVVYEESGLIPEGKFCTLMSWQEGELIKKDAIDEGSLYKHGVLLAKLHRQSKKQKIKHRKYWTADGLVGLKAKLGPYTDLKSSISKDQYQLVLKARKKIHRTLSKYEKENPDKFGLIHADLHFANVVWRKGEVYPIDFDDCGYGAYAWDVAIVLYSLEGCYDGVGLRVMEDAFLSGYLSVQDLDEVDFQILTDFRVGRWLVILGWLQARFDNAELKKYFYTHLDETMKKLKAYV